MTVEFDPPGLKYHHPEDNPSRRYKNRWAVVEIYDGAGNKINEVYEGNLVEMARKAYVLDAQNPACLIKVIQESKCLLG